MTQYQIASMPTETKVMARALRHYLTMMMMMMMLLLR
jgi:hypothetical protein